MTCLDCNQSFKEGVSDGFIYSSKFSLYDQCGFKKQSFTHFLSEST